MNLVKKNFFLLAGALCVQVVFAISLADLAGKRPKVDAPELVAEMKRILQVWINVPYNDLFYYTAHNAYASRSHGYTAGWNQSKRFLEQIAQYSVRGVELDIYEYGSDGVHLCHSSCGGVGMGALRPGGNNGEPLEQYFDYILTFLDGKKRRGDDVKDLNGGKDAEGKRYFTLSEAQKFLRALKMYLATGDRSAVDATGWGPGEGMYELLRRPPIITIHFEDYVKDGARLDRIIEQSGLAPYVLKPEDWNPGSYDGWPSIASMILAGKVVVMLSDKSPYGRTTPSKYLYWAFNEMWASRFMEKLGGISSDICEKVQNRGHDAGKYLMRVHYARMSPVGGEGDNDNFMNFWNTCAQKYGGIAGASNRYPNFVLSDFVDKGNIYTLIMKSWLDTYLSDLKNRIMGLSGKKVSIYPDEKASLPQDQQAIVAQYEAAYVPVKAEYDRQYADFVNKQAAYDQQVMDKAKELGLTQDRIEGFERQKAMNMPVAGDVQAIIDQAKAALPPFTEKAPTWPAIQLFEKNADEVINLPDDGRLYKDPRFDDRRGKDLLNVIYSRQVSGDELKK